MTTRPHTPPGCWPRLMTAAVAAAYVGEVSVVAFRRRVGAVWPRPINAAWGHQRWDREDLDAAVAILKRQPGATMPHFDAASVL